MATGGHIFPGRSVVPCPQLCDSRAQAYWSWVRGRLKMQNGVRVGKGGALWLPPPSHWGCAECALGREAQAMLSRHPHGPRTSVCFCLLSVGFTGLSGHFSDLPSFTEHTGIPKGLGMPWSREFWLKGLKWVQPQIHLGQALLRAQNLSPGN